MAPEKFTVGKLEGLRWAENDQDSPRDEWNWRLMIRVPDGVAGAVTLDEGLVLQMLHAGPFDTEPETLAQMDAFMREHSLLHNGLHHEIYLTDSRRTPPEKTRAILRQPVDRAD